MAGFENRPSAGAGDPSGDTGSDRDFDRVPPEEETPLTEGEAEVEEAAQRNAARARRQVMEHLAAAQGSAALADDSDRDFDRVPPAEAETLAAAAIAADPVEEAAQRNAARARKQVLDHLAALQAAERAAAGGPEAVAGPEAALLAARFSPTRGAERWPVKTVTDDDRNRINAAVQDTTVEALLLLERPGDMPLTRPVPRWQSKRADGSETTKWQVEARIIGYKWEKDGDFHIVIQSLTSAFTMIVEAPQEGTGSDGRPFVDDTSPFKAQIEAARKKLRDRLQPTPAFNNASLRARLTGIGFFDILHGQTGVAQSNAIELHPILDVEFLD